MSKRIVLLAAAVVLSCSVGARADEGEVVFKRYCAACHSLKTGENKIGPSLAGIAGRKAGTVPGFAYSEANKASGLTWDAATLEQYLPDPRKFMPGTKMVFPGVKKPEDRQALIAWLAEQH